MTAPDYNDGKWHGWNGGECPVDPQSVIEVHYINTFGGRFHDKARAAKRHDWFLVSMFRVTKPAPPKPREFHINPDNGGFYELHPEHDPVSLPPGFLHVVQKTTA